MSHRPSNCFFKHWPKPKSDRLNNYLNEAFYLQSFGYDELPISNPTIDEVKASESNWDYNNGATVNEVRAFRQRLALYSKNVDLGDDSEREAVAWNTFCKAEINCRLVNERYREHGTLSTFDGCEQIFHYARRKIADILKDVPLYEDLQFGFGPGANTTVRKITNVLNKLNAVPTCGKDAVNHLQGLWDTLPYYAFAHKGKCRISDGMLSFVPKNAITKRSVITEPLVSTATQRAIGRHIKKCMNDFGIDLKDQSVNRNLARLYSKDGRGATVDMTNASDNIAYVVPLDLLPIQWVEFLTAWRTSRVTYKKKGLSFELEKFSSMGNGFTFELESLIFYALAYGCCVYSNVKPEISVFGDDVLLPTEVFHLYDDVLRACGFEVNLKKSFNSGPFRESCGGDYYNGINIRPFYVKDRWSDARLISFLNYYYEDPLLSQSDRAYLINLLKPIHQMYGPAGYGDGHIHSDEKGHAHKRKKGWCGFVFKTWVSKPKVKEQYLPIGQDLIPTYGLRQNNEVEFEPTYRLSQFGEADYLKLVGDFSDLYLDNKVFRHQRRNPKVLEKVYGIRRKRVIVDPYVMRGSSGAKCIRVYYIPSGS